MIKIQSGDYQFLTINHSTGYNGSDPIVQANIDMSYSFRQKWEEVMNMLRDWQEQKKLIDANPAVREAYKNFQTMIALAKEPA